jgi:hypothetical protein
MREFQPNAEISSVELISSFLFLEGQGSRNLTLPLIQAEVNEGPEAIRAALECPPFIKNFDDC